MHRQAAQRRGGIGLDRRDRGVENPHVRGRLEHAAQRLLDLPGIDRHRVDPIDEQAQGRGLDAQAPVRGDLLHQTQRAAPQFPRGQDLRRDRRERDIGGEDRHLQQHTARALGVDQQQVVVRTEHAEQIAQPEAAIGRVQQQRVQLAMGIVGQQQIQPADGCRGDELAAILFVEGEHFVDAARRAALQRKIARQRRLDVQVQQQHAHAGVGEETAQVGRRRGLADPALGRDDGHHDGRLGAAR